MLRIMSLLFLSSISLFCYGAEFEKPNVDINQEKLLSGELQTYIYDYKGQGDDTKKRALGIILIDAPIDEVWEVMNDWPAMGEYVPDLKYYKVLTEEKNENNITERLIAGKLAVPLISVEYSMAVKFDEAAYTVSWNLLSSEETVAYKQKGIDVLTKTSGLKNIEGFSLMEAHNSKQTVYYYAPIIEISLPVPSFAENYMAKVTLSGYMEAIKERAEARFSSN